MLVGKWQSRRLQHTVLVCLLLLASKLGYFAQAGNARDVTIEARLRVLGQEVLPWTAKKQQAVANGVAEVLGDGILATDVELTVLAIYPAVGASQFTGRRMLQPHFAGLDVALSISTTRSKAAAEVQALSAATSQSFRLASAFLAQGLETQQLVLQAAEIPATSPISQPALAPTLPTLPLPPAQPHGATRNPAPSQAPSQPIIAPSTSHLATPQPSQPFTTALPRKISLGQAPSQFFGAPSPSELAASWKPSQPLGGPQPATVAPSPSPSPSQAAIAPLRSSLAPSPQLETPAVAPFPSGLPASKRSRKELPDTAQAPVSIVATTTQDAEKEASAPAPAQDEFPMSGILFYVGLVGFLLIGIVGCFIFRCCRKRSIAAMYARSIPSELRFYPQPAPPGQLRWAQRGANFDTDTSSSVWVQPSVPDSVRLSTEGSCIEAPPSIGWSA